MVVEFLFLCSQLCFADRHFSVRLEAPSLERPLSMVRLMGVNEETKPPPRVWAICLATAMKSQLHGAWTDALQAEEDIADALREIIDSSPTPGAQEVSILHSHGCYGHVPNPTPGAIAKLGAFVRDYGEVGAVLASCYHGGNLDRAAKAMKDFVGEFADIAEFAAGEVSEAERERPDFDPGEHGRSLELRGEIYVAHLSKGIAVFRTHRPE